MELEKINEYKMDKNSYEQPKFSDDLLELFYYNCRKLMKDQIPPLTVAIDLVIYREDQNKNTLSIKYHGFVVNQLLWYKLRKCEYQLQAIQEEQKEEFLKINRGFKEFPEEQIMEGYRLFYSFKLVDSINFFKKKSLRQQMEQLSSYQQK